MTQSKFALRLVILWLGLISEWTTHAATLFVWSDSPNPTPPFSTWETAARILQEGADAAESGDTVLVTNGVYNTGGRLIQGEVVNRLAIPSGVVVQSVEGPEVTVIEGAPRIGTPGGTSSQNGNGEGAIRCAYLGRDAVLAGFTLRGGHTRTNGLYDWDQSGGGAWCDSQAKLVKCILTNNAAHHMGGGSFRAELLQCDVVNNKARYGGGVCLATVSESVLTRNAGENGGGAYLSRLSLSTVSFNSANIGGGAMGGSMVDCLVTGNVAGQWGGGVSQTTLQKCRIENNSAERGGGTFVANLFGCVVTGNTADLGGGTAGGALHHCTVTGNFAGSGGGSYLSSINHSIVYFNDAIFGPNHEGATVLNSCTTPLPESGSGNLVPDPQLASLSHLSADSPCQATDASTPQLPTDLDGEPWQPLSSMGADQFIAGQATGSLEVQIRAPGTSVAVDHAGLFRADIEGRTTGSQWEFGDGTVVRNQPLVRHAWNLPGEYVVTLTAFNDSFPEGVRSSVTLRIVVQPIHYVSLSTQRPTPPFASWETATPSIQAAIDAATIPGSLILVTNGLYNRGGVSLPGDVLVNRVALTKPVIVRSVHGPAVTLIAGAGPVGDTAVRCAFVGRDAVLSGFTLTNGHTRTLGAPAREQRGAGLSGQAAGRITHCVITGNLARQFGGGAYRGSLVNCTVIRNRSLDGGGGAYESVLEDCTLEENFASNSGGGATRSTLTRSLLIGNSAPLGAGAYFGTLDFCRLERNVTEGDGYGGGANGSLLRDCVLTNNIAYSGGGTYAASLVRCRLEDNEARRDGGGATDSTLTDCLLLGNLATHGGGASHSVLTECQLTLNEASVAGGGADGGELEHCTLTSNSAYFGGATERATLRNCIVRENTAVFGGGGYRDLFFNCLLTGNRATQQGGGAFQGMLYQCTVTANSADVGGGTYDGTNRNSIVYFNTALAGPDFQGSTLIASCTSPTPALLPGNTSEPPAFLHPATGDFRLRADSPCIDTGEDFSHLLADDLDGNPRPIDGDGDGKAAFDMGAFEYDPAATDSNADGVPDLWYRQYGLNAADPDVGTEDPDRDRLTTFQEWIAETNPTDATSALNLAVSNLPPITLYVFGSAGRLYTLLSRPTLDTSDPDTSKWMPVPGHLDVPGQGDRLAFQDTNAAASRYYRVEVQWPVATNAHPATVQPPSLYRESTNLRALANRREQDLMPLFLASSETGEPVADPRLRIPLAVPSDGTLGMSEVGITAGTERRLARHGTPNSGVNSASTNTHIFRVPSGSTTGISPLLRGQEPFMLYAASARRPTLEWGRGATFRGVAGGTDAETYHWKELTSSTRPHFWSHHVEDPPVVTTLEWLEQARDYDAELVLTVNTRGRGRTVQDSQGRLLWSIDPASNNADYLAQLAADWVRYVNLVAPKYRLTSDGQLPPDLAATDPEAARILQELATLGNGTNAWRYRLATVADPDTEVDPWLERPLLLAAGAPPITRKVAFWEIGNEVETPMNASDPRGFRPMDNSINLNPAQFVERYLRITEAMRKVDPTIQVGPCPNNPWGPRAGIENEHLIDLLARPEATVDVLYYHYYPVWVGDYFRPSDVNRNLRSLKNFAYLLDAQYAGQFARAGRARVPSIVSEWNPDWTIHPPIERFMASVLSTAEVFLTFVELQVHAAHYWENPDGRASGLVFDKLQTHLGDRFLGSSIGNRLDDGSYVGFGNHPSFASNIRVYATQRSSDSKVFIWLLNLSDTTSHTVVCEYPFPVREVRTHILRSPRQATTYYTSITDLEWISETTPANQPSTVLPPSTLAILELVYDAVPVAPRPPIITSLSTTRAAKDSEIVILGEGFAENPGANVVHFGLGRALVISATPSSLQVQVPATAMYGSVSVTAHGFTATSREFFTLAANPQRDDAITFESLRPLPQRIYSPEGAPMVTAPVTVLLADWPGDGRLHLAGLTSRAGSVLPHTIDLFPNASRPAQPAFSTPLCQPQMPRCSLPLNASPFRMAFGDLDGDGRLDLACVDRHAWQVAAWRNALPSSDRSFDVMGTFPTAMSPSHVAIQDLDLDGRPDLVVTHAAQGSLGVLRNLSSGAGIVRFATNHIFHPARLGQMQGPHSAVVGDLVGDGRADIVVASRSSAGLVLFRNNSSPGRMDLVPLPEIPGARIESLALGDVDGDGRLDIVAAGQWPNGGVMIWRNTGEDGFERSDFPTSRDPRQLALADITGDGRVDVLTVDNDTSSVSVLRNRSKPGAVAFDARQAFPIPGLLPNDPICLATGDIDGDGRPDVVVGHFYSGFLTLLQNVETR